MPTDEREFAEVQPASGGESSITLERERGECECRGEGGTCQGGNPHKGSCKGLDFWWQIDVSSKGGEEQ